MRTTQTFELSRKVRLTPRKGCTALVTIESESTDAYRIHVENPDAIRRPKDKMLGSTEGAAVKETPASSFVKVMARMPLASASREEAHRLVDLAFDDKERKEAEAQ